MQVYRLISIFRYLLRKELDAICVPYATQVMPNSKASDDIFKQSTILNNVSFASLNGDAVMNTGTTSRRSNPGVNPNIILGKAQVSRRRATILTEYVSQQLPVSRVISGSSSAVSSMGYNSQPVYAEQTVTMGKHEYGTYPPVMLPPTEECVKPMNDSDLDTSLQDGQFGLGQSYSM